MAFIQAAAPYGQREGSALSADNVPERHIVVDLLRKAAPMLGLKPPVIATLEAMLGCLAPKRNHHTVFASNATLAFRRNGISDRTLRRHVEQLIGCGLLVRNDSPNRKRYSRHNATDGQSLRFGFDLSPLFARLHEIARLAVATAQQAEKLAYLRCKIRAAAQVALSQNPHHADAQTALRLLRRKLSLEECDAILACLETVAAEGPADTQPTQTRPLPRTNTAETSASNGQNVRHYQRSKREITEEEEPLSVDDLLKGCPEAAHFSLRTIRTTADVVSHSRTLAPMIGIDAANLQAAQNRLGPERAAVTVWLMVQFHNRIHKVGAYFRSITSGSNCADFNPMRIVRRLAKRAALLPADHAIAGS